MDFQNNSSFFDEYKKKELSKSPFIKIKPSFSLKSVPKVIGEGSYGCVHKPSLKCAKKKNIYTKKISKLMEEKDAKREMKEYNIIKKFDKTKKYHLGVPTKCKFKKSLKNLKAMDECTERRFFSSNIDNLHLLIMSDGGINLDDYSSIIEKRDPTKENIKKNFLFWKEVSRLLEGLLKLKKSKIIHHDLKPQNIVYDESKNRLNFIDFGLMTNSKDIIKSSLKSTNKHSALHWSYPFELFFYNKTNFYFSSRQKNEMYESVYFKEKLKTFLFYTKKETSNKIIDEFAESYRKHIFPKLKKIKYDKFIKKTIFTIDTYGMGIALIYVFMGAQHLFGEDDSIKNIKHELYELFSNMVSPDFTIRYTIEEIIEKYEIIILKWENMRLNTTTAK